VFNLFIVLIFTFAVALVCIYLISAHDRRLKKKQQQDRHGQPEEDQQALDYRQFSKVCMDICEHLKLEVEDVTQMDNDEIIIRATTLNPITKVEFLVIGFHLHHNDTVENNKVMEISDQIVSERLSKGIIMTTGKIDPTIKNLPELAPMEFIDGTKLKELIQEYKINYWIIPLHHTNSSWIKTTLLRSQKWREISPFQKQLLQPFDKQRKRKAP